VLLLMSAGRGCQVCASASSDPPIANDVSLKAAFVLNFAKFVEWPADAVGASQPFVVEIVGDDPLATVVDDIFRGATIGNRPVVVSRKGRVSDTPIHLLYVSESEERRLDDILKAVRERPCLTVGAFDRFAERGGMIHLFVKDGKVRFSVNVGAAARARLAISSRLLRLASQILPG
jgi:uncharacterized protein DUF4154